ncbi:DUF3792 domain-containing protein [Bartonella sp. B30(2025)]
METHIPKDTQHNNNHLFNDNNFSKKAPPKTEYPLFHTPITWSAIIGGVVTTFAISICLSFLVATLGFNKIDLYSSSPFQGSFLSIGVGSLIVTIISLASGGFVAGRFAETSGAFHGFLTWALLTLIIAIQVVFLASSAASLGTKAVIESGSAVQQTITDDVLPVLSKLSSESFENFVYQKDGKEVDFSKLQSELRTFLNKSDIPALDPDHLKQVYNAALKDIGSAINAFKNDPSHYRTYLKNLAERLSDRVQSITEKIDRNDIINAFMNNGMTRAEAEKTTDQALDVYQTAQTKIEQAITTLEKQIDTLSKKLDKLAEDTRETADQALQTATNISWWFFLCSLLSGIISSIFGYYGYRSRHDTLVI